MNQYKEMNIIESPCNSQCKLVDDMSFCVSCFRTLDEITLWTRMTEAERQEILDSVPQRRRDRQA